MFGGRVAPVVLRELGNPLNQHVISKVGVPELDGPVRLLVHQEDLTAGALPLLG